MFSVVIPLYNKERYIASTLNSVLNQSFKDFEVIIVNDGSTDRSVEVVKKFDDSRIRLVDQPNAGVSAARNKGIKEAKFDWVAFLDADDRWDVEFLSEIANAIKKYPNNLIFAGGKAMVKNGVVERYTNEFLPQYGQTGVVNLYQIMSKYNGPINSSNSVIRKQHLEKNGLFRIGQKNYEDHDLWIRLCINEAVIYINKELSFVIMDDISSASKGVLSSNDFAFLIQRFHEINDKLSQSDKKFFEKYYNRFILFTFMKYKKYYSRKDIGEIKKESSKLLTVPYIQTLYFLTRVNVKYDYAMKIGRLFRKYLY